MKSTIASAILLLEMVCGVLGIQTTPRWNAQPLMEIKIEKGIPYGRDAASSDWVRLGDAIAPPVEWVNDDVGRRNEAVTLDGAPEIYAQMVSEDVGWLVVTYGRGVAAADTYVYQTSDGGKTWNECTPPPLSWHISKIGFISEERLLIGERVFNSAPLHFTADGGSTWTEIPTPDPIAECVAIFIKNNKITILFRTGDMMRSRDFGDTWETVRSAGLPDL